MRHVAALTLLSLSALACSSSSKREEAPPVLQNQIDLTIDRLRHEKGVDYVNDLRRLAAYEGFAVPRLIDLLDDRDAHMRRGAAFALGDINDPRVVPALKDHTEDKNEIVRLEIARSLLHRGDWSGIPTLIQGLRSSDPSIRMHCDEALRDQTMKDFGFPVEGTAEERAAAIARWEQWWRTAQAEVQG
jgi:HEAT repeat protein